MNYIYIYSIMSFIWNAGLLFYFSTQAEELRRVEADKLALQKRHAEETERLRVEVQYNILNLYYFRFINSAFILS